MKKTLANYYLLYMLFCVSLVIVIISVIYDNMQKSFLEATVNDIRENVVKQYKDELKNRVNIAENYIISQKKLTEKKLRQSIILRVEEAYAIANNLYLKYKDIKTPKEIQELIIESLRDIRFNNGRGYYFIDDIEGNSKLYPIRTDFEGENIIDFQDTNKKYVIKEFINIVKEKTEGFSSYYTMKYAGQEDNISKKIAYVKLFKPYNFIIGTGEYLEDVEEDIKKKIINEVNNFTGVNENSYINIFKVNNHTGGKDYATILLNPIRKDLENTNLSSFKVDVDGKHYVEEVRQALTKNDNVFVTFKYKNTKNHKIVKKLSYIKRLNDWDWVLSTGVHYEHIEKLVKINKEKTEEIQRDGVKKAFVVFGIVCIFIIILSIFLSKKINKAFEELIKFFSQAAFEKKKIDINSFISDDFKQLAYYANEMIENIHIKREKLKQLNEELELAVDIKKEELIEVNKFLEDKNIELEKNYYTDALTSLSNRNQFLKDLESLEEVSVIIFDIDGFKNINDFYGIKTGDYLLIELSKVLSDFANKNELKAYRLSSDEFLISIDRKIEQENLEVLRYSFYEEFRKKDFYDASKQNKLSVSLTCAIAKDKQHILSRINVALTYAKENKLSCAVYDENNVHMNKHKYNIYWREKIQFAIDNDLIEPYFQKIINVNNPQEKKYESLIRIIIEDEIITPFMFLDVSKETKQYPCLTKIMIEKTFKKFQNEEVEFSINISMLDVENEETIKFLKEKIVEYNIHNKLILEILETENMINSEKFIPFVDSMRKLGVSFALDDFGSGYSNFSFLLKMCPKYLKIDGSLIQNITHDSNSLNIVKTIVLFAKQMNSEVIAEFVENEEIVRILKDLDVHYMQGYYFSKPSKDL
ncbi:cache domain-containing protein [Sulfurospirillum arcachonense]|uniref:cache domain-containing protein n=1 Tax=Sulfurospirillum arcachonense TaxID=57666 RepID=UPI0004B0510D|nr:cache domain-containing protein [Sulfurospirillum arcachonense]